MRFFCVIVTAAWLLTGTPAVSTALAASADDTAPRAGAGAPVVIDGAPSRGPATAQVTIVEFSDFQCPFSAQSARTMGRLLELYPTQVRWVSKQFPLKFHRQAPLAHEAALAADEQGRFFEMYQLIFLNQDRLAREDLDGYARELGLDMARFSEALDQRRLRPKVVRDLLEARTLGVFATPTFIMNGQRVIGAKGLPQLRALVEHELRAVGARPAPPDPVAPSTGR